MKTKIRNKNKQSIRNITRFDYGRTAFQGWRVSLSYKGINFIKYVPDADFRQEIHVGSNAKTRSFIAAQRILDYILISISKYKKANKPLSQRMINKISKTIKNHSNF